jgi:hypothetical protein
MGGLNQLMGSQRSTFCNWISNDRDEKQNNILIGSVPKYRYIENNTYQNPYHMLYQPEEAISANGLVVQGLIFVEG